MMISIQTMMRFASFHFLILGLALLAFCPARESAAQNTEPELEANLIYTRVDEGPLRLDLMVPTKGQGPYPVVIVIHGGAWRHGDKLEVRPFMLKLAERGFASVSPEYRLAPENPFPAAVHDLKEVVRWVKLNARERLLDAKHIGAYGQTAGAHLALMLGVTSDEDGLEKPMKPTAVTATTIASRPDSRVQAVVSVFGPTDLAADDLTPLSRQLISDFLNSPPSTNLDLARKASPLTYVTRDDPPILLFHNRGNVDIPFTQAEKLKSALEKVGNLGRLEMVSESYRLPREIEQARLNKLAFDFLDNYLKAR